LFTRGQADVANIIRAILPISFPKAPENIEQMKLQQELCGRKEWGSVGTASRRRRVAMNSNNQYFLHSGQQQFLVQRN
jgi:hypothetical protein